MPFDSREYEWSDITVVTGNRDVIGIRGIKYTEKEEVEHLHAKGKYAHSIQGGNNTVEGEITVLQSEYEALVKAGNGSVLKLRGLNIVCEYGNPTEGVAPMVDIVHGIRFSEAGKDWKQGDKFKEITLPFLAIRVQNQAL
jgi:hypothetical protein